MGTSDHTADEGPVEFDLRKALETDAGIRDVLYNRVLALMDSVAILEGRLADTDRRLDGLFAKAHADAEITAEAIDMLRSSVNLFRETLMASLMSHSTATTTAMNATLTGFAARLERMEANAPTSPVVKHLAEALANMSRNIGDC